MTKVFIDGSAGTTGLRIRERLSGRKDLELLTLSEELRKDANARKDMLNTADIAFLCLPDAAAVEAVSLIDSDHVAVIDTSTAHRVSDGWAYGFAELSDAHRKAIVTSKRVANPGCHASGFIAGVYPLVSHGVIPADFPLTAYSLTGYSGGGKKLIAEYEDESRDVRHESHRIYGTNLRHKQALDQAHEDILRTLDAMHSGLSGDLISEDLRLCLSHLGEILGIISDQEVLGNIFKHFCIGK